MVTGYSTVSVTHSVMSDIKAANPTACTNYFVGCISFDHISV